MSTTPVRLVFALNQFLESVEIAKERTIDILQVPFQVREGSNGWWNHALDDFAERFLATAVGFQGSDRLIIEIHVSAHACSVRACTMGVVHAFVY